MAAGKKLNRISVSSAAAAVLSRLTKDAREFGEWPVIAVELAYLDHRDAGSGDREQHMQDALHIAAGVQQVLNGKQFTLVLQVFINDFVRDTVCGLTHCPPAPRADDEQTDCPRHGNAITIDGVTWPVDALTMRGTRNRATKAAKKALTRGLKKGLGLQLEASKGESAELGEQLFALTGDGAVLLGSREAGSNRITPRCTLLMAQHYVDVWHLARRRYPKMTDLWAVDFNRSIERDRVRMGAEASFVLHQWPADLSARIVNCVYFEGATTLTALQTTCSSD